MSSTPPGSSSREAATAAARNRRPKLLVLTPRLPYPVIGGDRLRIHRLCRTLAQRFDLTLLSLCDQREDLGREIPDRVFGRVERVYLPRWRSWLSCLGSLPTATPLQVAYYRSAEFARRVAALAPEHDAVLAHLIRTREYLKEAEAPTILEMTDAISLNYARVRERGTSRGRLRSWIYALEAGRLAAYEREAARSVDAAVLVSDVDRSFLFGDVPGGAPNVLVCTNGVDVSELPYQFDAAGRDAVFIGNLTTVQNLDAAQYFAAEILPLVNARAPEVRFRVIGRIRPRDARQLASLPNVDVTREVESVPAAARGGAVGVCPLRLGAGIQNKILEYMALGLPTVTTTLGLEGLGAADGQELRVADDPAAIAGAVLDLLRDREGARIVAARARAYVERSHAWDATLAPLVAAVEALVRPASDGSRAGRA